jgi:hypothetical protein
MLRVEPPTGVMETVPWHTAVLSDAALPVTVRLVLNWALMAGVPVKKAVSQVLPQLDVVMVGAESWIRLALVVVMVTLADACEPVAATRLTELGLAEIAPPPPPLPELLKFTVMVTAATPAGSDGVKVTTAWCAPVNTPTLPRFKESVAGVI